MNVLIRGIAVPAMVTLAAWSPVAAAGALSAALGPQDGTGSGNVGGASSDTLRVTLARAEALALEGNASLAALRERAGAAEARARGARAMLLPTLGADAGFVRSDDPVAAFGSRLRQGLFTERDFAVDRLNDPGSVNDWAAGAGVSWAGADAAVWAGRDAAAAAARAQALQVERGRDQIVFRTRFLFWEAVGALGRLEAARASEVAAQATLDLIQRRRQEGLLTDADVLQAMAALAGARAGRVQAERAGADSRSQLALTMGMEGLAVPVLDGDADARAAEAMRVGAHAAGPHGDDAPIAERADLRASLQGVRAFEAGSRQARAARLPRGEVFARLDTHAPRALDGMEPSVTVGVLISMPLFTGGRIGAAQDEAEAMERAARLEHEDRVRAARAEVESARRGVVAAFGALDASRAALNAAEEAHRLLSRRLEEGLATTAELLQVEARASGFRTGVADAEAALQQAVAALELAVGGGAAGAAGGTGPAGGAAAPGARTPSPEPPSDDA